MLRFDAGRASVPANAGAVRIRRLGPGDMTEVEKHLLSLDPADRHARFHLGVSDGTVAAYARRLDPARAVLVGAFCPAGRLLGLAEAHPTAVPRTVEVAVTVVSWCRRQGLGKRVVSEVVGQAFAAGAEAAQFLFTEDNAALAGLAAALGARVNVLRGHAAISRAARAGAWQGAGAGPSAVQGHVSRGSGKVTIKVAPPPGVSSAAMLPPCS
jgi:hypothetical protein